MFCFGGLDQGGQDLLHTGKSESNTEKGRQGPIIYIRERGKVTLIQEGKDLLHTVERWRVTPIQGLIYGTEVLLALKDS